MAVKRYIFESQGLVNEITDEEYADIADIMDNIDPKKLSFDNLFKGKLRLMVPFKSKEKPMIQKMKEFLEKNGYSIDLKTGLASRNEVIPAGPKKGATVKRSIKIGKLLRKMNDLYSNYRKKQGKEDEDKARKNLAKVMPTALSRNLLGFKTFWDNKSEYYRKNPEEALSKHSKYVMIISRSPIDVLRMSDFDKITSCHSPESRGGHSYSQCAVAEAQGHGLVVFLLEKSDLPEDFDPNAKKEIFRDDKRDVNGIVPVSRIRLRKFVNEETYEELAVPEDRVYGKMVDGFKKAVLTWAREQELFKKYEEDGWPDLKDWARYGGSYEDTRDSDLLNRLSQRNTNVYKSYKNAAHEETTESTITKYRKASEEISQEYNETLKHAYVGFDITKLDEWVKVDMYGQVDFEFILKEPNLMKINFYKRELQIILRNKFYMIDYVNFIKNENLFVSIDLYTKGFAKTPRGFDEFSQEVKNEIDDKYTEIKKFIENYLIKKKIINTEFPLDKREKNIKLEIEEKVAKLLNQVHDGSTVNLGKKTLPYEVNLSYFIAGDFIVVSKVVELQQPLETNLLNFKDSKFARELDFLKKIYIYAVLSELKKTLSNISSSIILPVSSLLGNNLQETSRLIEQMMKERNLDWTKYTMKAPDPSDDLDPNTESIFTKIPGLQQVLKFNPADTAFIINFDSIKEGLALSKPALFENDDELSRFVDNLINDEQSSELVTAVKPLDIANVLATNLDLHPKHACHLTLSLIKRANDKIEKEGMASPGIEHYQFPVPPIRKRNEPRLLKFKNELSLQQPSTKVNITPKFTVEPHQWAKDGYRRPEVDDWPYDAMTVAGMSPKAKGRKRGLTSGKIPGLKEEIKPLDRSKVMNLKPTDKLLVYHGTSFTYLPEFINGFDATQEHHRHYGGPRHSGLFVTLDLESAERFSGGRNNVVLEIEVRAKNLHGTNYSGNIGRKQQIDDKTKEWIKNKYPNSFRPYLSMTMLQSPEPQGLLLGLVKPNQIKRIGVIPGSKTGEVVWYTRQEFANLGKTSKKGYDPAKPIKDVGFDLASTKSNIEDFYNYASKEYNIPVERIAKTFKYYAKKDSEMLTKGLEDFGLQPKAAEAMKRKIIKQSSLHEKKDSSDTRRWKQTGNPFNTDLKTRQPGGDGAGGGGIYRITFQSRTGDMPGSGNSSWVARGTKGWNSMPMKGFENPDDTNDQPLDKEPPTIEAMGGGSVNVNSKPQNAGDEDEETPSFMKNAPVGSSMPTTNFGGKTPAQPGHYRNWMKK